MSNTVTKTKQSTNPKKKKQQQKSAAKKTPAGDGGTKKLATDPPPECSKSDFESLLVDASGLADYGEASSELIDCARYGEVDAVRAILDVWSPGKRKDDHLPPDDSTGRPARIVDASDASGSTPLHKACANKHASTARLLLSRGADVHALNGSGNTPLHWAASAGGSDCVALLLGHADALHSLGRGGRADVLLKNGFGRSALTEAFASGDTATVQHVLNHDSAEEDRLIGGLDRKDAGESEADEVAGDGGATGSEERGIVHEFDFLRGSEEGDAAESDERPTVLIRELVSRRHADETNDVQFAPPNSYPSLLRVRSRSSTPTIPSARRPRTTQPASASGAPPSSWPGGSRRPPWSGGWPAGGSSSSGPGARYRASRPRSTAVRPR